MNYSIILSSSSPRRSLLLSMICPEFQRKVIIVEEVIDKKMPILNVAREIAILKAKPWLDIIKGNECVITADTIVSLDGEIFGKPNNSAEAKGMLKTLSGRRHDVSTGVALAKQGEIQSFCDISHVTFAPLSNHFIDEYVQTNSPLDKAGGYGIQEDFGMIAVEKIEGCYSSIMGLPLARLKKKLMEMNRC